MQTAFQFSRSASALSLQEAGDVDRDIIGSGFVHIGIAVGRRLSRSTVRIALIVVLRLSVLVEARNFRNRTELAGSQLNRMVLVIMLDRSRIALP